MSADPGRRSCSASRRPPGGGAGGVGGRAVGRRPAGRLGSRCHQGRSAGGRSRCARSSGRSASTATCPTRPSPSTTGASAASSSTCASRRTASDWRSLLATADVFISNLRPDSLDGLGLEPEATVRPPSAPGVLQHQRVRPAGATTATVPPTTSEPSGPGPGCPCRWPTTRATRSMPEAGSATTSPGWPPWPASWPRSSSSARPGRGRVVEVSLLRTGAYVLGWDLGLQMTLGKVARAEPRDRNQAPLMNPYRAADGQWFFFTGLEAARHIAPVCRALGHPELLDDPRFADAPPSAGTGPRSSPSWTRSSPGDRWPSGPSGSMTKGCGGLRPRRRPRWSETRSCWPTTASSRSMVAAWAVRTSVNGPVTFSDLAADRYAAVPVSRPAHR